MSCKNIDTTIVETEIEEEDETETETPAATKDERVQDLIVSAT